MAPFIKEAKVNFWLIYLVNIMQEMTKNPWQTSYIVSIYTCILAQENFSFATQGSCNNIPIKRPSERIH